ncbi:J domain-containing protein [Mycetocola miduiensis]|uniref:DnaJ domain-containing protein n=1 Tax=Mycetocola miduiensis TaxID=995034 RepID=A0A1I4Z4T0_9MICO|nr:DnaJ domain-containing protein [Mycetocola miduiensis]SFN45281.1 DnaJ domain-containing protein [Mycetocola miduiensis]
MSRETYYDVLGAPPASNLDDLKRAYRRALRASHPDVGGSAESFRRVQEAWAVLGDAARRSEYDRLNLPRASAPPKGETRRERASSRRTADEPTATATPTFATAHGHPGGYSRSRYLDIAREWMLSPQPPTPPAKPPRIPHERDRFLHMWGVVCLQLFVTFVLIVAGLAAIAAAAGNLPTIPTDALFPVLRHVTIALFGVAFLCGGAVATLRLGTSPARAEVRRVRARNRDIYAGLWAAHAADLRAFHEDLGRLPESPDSFLRSPYSPESVMVAPAAAQVELARALAQEQIAGALKSLSDEFTIWDDVRIRETDAYASHLVVGPQGLFLVEPLSERPRLDPRLTELADAVGVAALSGVLFVDLDPAAVNAPPAKLGEVPTLSWRIGITRLAPMLGGGIHGIERGESWEVRQLVERVARRVAFA